MKNTKELQEYLLTYLHKYRYTSKSIYIGGNNYNNVNSGGTISLENPEIQRYSWNNETKFALQELMDDE